MLGVLIILLLALISSFLISRSPETTVQQGKFEDCHKPNVANVITPAVDLMQRPLLVARPISINAHRVVLKRLKHWLTYWVGKLNLSTLKMVWRKTNTLP